MDWEFGTERAEEEERTEEVLCLSGAGGSVIAMVVYLGTYLGVYLGVYDYLIQ